MAAINFVYTQIGGGKSLFSVHWIIRELQRTERRIVTNLPLNVTDCPPGAETLADYCHRNIAKPVNLWRRLAILTDEQALEFWRYVPLGNFDLTGLARIEYDSKYHKSVLFKLPLVEHPIFGKVTDLGLRGFTTDPARMNENGVLYIIDEAHLLFPARNWQKVPGSMEHYISQLRKVNDDVVFVTQHPEKLDKNMRRNGTDWWQVRNLAKQPMWMGVTLDKRFRWYHYPQDHMPDRTSKPVRSGGFRLGTKARIEFLYRTMAGAAVEGNFVSEESSFKGRSPLLWVAVIVLVIAGSRLLPSIIENGVAGIVGGSAHGLEKGVARGLGNPAPATASPALPAKMPTPMPASPGPVVVMPPNFGNVFAGPVHNGPPPPPPVYCTGICAVGGGRMLVMLSDGRTADSANGEVQGWGDQYVRVFGMDKIPWKKHQ